MPSTLARVAYAVILSALGCDADVTSPPPDAGPAVVVTGVYPSIGPHHAGDRLILVGHGFGDPPDVLVEFNPGNAATIVPGGNDRELIIIVPALSPGTYHPTIIAFGGHSIALPPIILESIRPTIPGGSLWAVLNEAPSGTIQPGSSFELGFAVWFTTNLDDVYDVSCTSGGWGVATAPAQLSLPETEMFSREPGAGFRVRVDVPADASGEVRLRCQVAAQHNSQLLGTTGDIQLAVGATFPPARTIPIDLNEIVGGSGYFALGTRDLAVVEPGMRTGLLFYNIMRKAGSYTVTASFSDNAGGAWSAVAPAKILMTLPAEMGLRVNVTAASGALPTHLIVTIRSDEDPLESGEYLVRLAPTP